MRSTKECGYPSAGKSLQSESNPLIAVCFDTLLIQSGTGNEDAGIYYNKYETCPVSSSSSSSSSGGDEPASDEPCLIVQWYKMSHLFSRHDMNMDFEAVLYKSGRIVYLYNKLGNLDGGSATIGIQGPDSGPTYDEYKYLSRNLTEHAGIAIYSFKHSATLKNRNNSSAGLNIIGVSFGYKDVAEFELVEGRYFSMQEAEYGSNVVLVGNHQHAIAKRHGLLADLLAQRVIPVHATVHLVDRIHVAID